MEKRKCGPLTVSAVGLGLMVLMYVPFHLDTMDVLVPAILAVSTVVMAWAGRHFYTRSWAAFTPWY